MIVEKCYFCSSEFAKPVEDGYDIFDCNVCLKQNKLNVSYINFNGNCNSITVILSKNKGLFLISIHPNDNWLIIAKHKSYKKKLGTYNFYAKNALIPDTKFDIQSNIDINLIYNTISRVELLKNVY